jgi:serine/threonine-protein kinase
MVTPSMLSCARTRRRPPTSAARRDAARETASGVDGARRRGDGARVAGRPRTRAYAAWLVLLFAPGIVVLACADPTRPVPPVGIAAPLPGPTTPAPPTVPEAPIAPPPVGVGVALTHVGTVGNFACGIAAQTELAYCWGDNHQGALGSGDGPGTDGVPVLVGGGGLRFRSISVGYYTTCGIESVTGRAYCWGSDASGQLGDDGAGTRSVPTLVAGGRLRFSSISASGQVTCGVEAPTGAAYCWGANTYGQVGDGTTTDRLLPMLVRGSREFSSISAGGEVSCGVEAGTGAGYCWGRNNAGTLGDGTTTDRSSPTPVGGGLRFSSISASGLVACGVEAGTGVGYCWGANANGQVGDGTTTDRLLPTPVGGGSPRFVSIDAGWSMACGIEAGTGAAYCWGRNRNGTMGDGTTADRLVSTLVGGGRLRFSTLSAGGAGQGYEVCGIEAATGVPYCWGHARLVPIPLWTVTPAAPAVAAVPPPRARVRP